MTFAIISHQLVQLFIDWNEKYTSNDTLNEQATISDGKNEPLFSIELFKIKNQIRNDVNSHFLYAMSTDIHPLHKITGNDSFLLITPSRIPRKSRDFPLSAAKSRQFLNQVLSELDTIALKLGAARLSHVPVLVSSGKPDVWYGMRLVAGEADFTRIKVRYNMLTLTIPDCLSNPQQLNQFFKSVCQTSSDSFDKTTSMLAYDLSATIAERTLVTKLFKLTGADFDSEYFSIQVDFATFGKSYKTFWSSLMANYFSSATFLNSSSFDFNTSAAQQAETGLHQMSLATLTKTVANDISRQKIAATLDKVSNAFGHFLLQAVSGNPLDNRALFSESSILDRLSSLSLFSKESELEQSCKSVAGIVPFDTLLYRFAIHVVQLASSNVSSLFVTLEHEWKQLASEVEQLWKGARTPVPLLVNSSDPQIKLDYRWSLLHQKLLLLNYCAEAITLNHVHKLSEPGLDFQVQLPEMLTEDMLRLQDDELRKKSAHERALRHSGQLVSDMAAFKAAHGTTASFESFVKWHSPRDWIPDNADDPLCSKGSLSTRMQAPDCLWQQLWLQTEAKSAADQKRLFDSEKLGETICFELLAIPITELALLFLPIFLQIAIDSLQSRSSFGLACSTWLQQQALTLKQQLGKVDWTDWNSDRLTFFLTKQSSTVLKPALPLQVIVDELANAEAIFDYSSLLLESEFFAPLKLCDAQLQDILTSNAVGLDTVEQIDWAWAQIVQAQKYTESFNFIESGKFTMFASLKPEFHQTQICISESISI